MGEFLYNELYVMDADIRDMQLYLEQFEDEDIKALKNTILDEIHTFNGHLNDYELLREYLDSKSVDIIEACDGVLMSRENEVAKSKIRRLERGCK